MKMRHFSIRRAQNLVQSQGNVTFDCFCFRNLLRWQNVSDLLCTILLFQHNQRDHARGLHPVVLNTDDNSRKLVFHGQ